MSDTRFPILEQQISAKAKRDAIRHAILSVLRDLPDDELPPQLSELLQADEEATAELRKALETH